jgi:A/G-specific adenine glycosylase
MDRTTTQERRVLLTVSRWFDQHARELPWRDEAATPWAVMVSEFMLQQTPVNRVLPVYASWIERWPTPSSLASAPLADALRAWGRLGYPRRAARLHAAAVAIRDEHGGVVPSDPVALRELPGIGEYTAGAIAAFAFGQRIAVLDTNVRRVHARAFDGVAYPRSASATRDEVARAVDRLPTTPAAAARASAAVMELGALICTSRAPACERCPISGDCAWQLAGSPAWDGPPRRGQSWAGTDRQCRGALMAVLREASASVPLSALEAAWPTDQVQRMRALDSLVADGLIEPLAGRRYRLPH